MHVYLVGGERQRKTWLEMVKNVMKGLGLASVDALNRHARMRKIVAGTCWSRFAWSSPGILPRMSRPIKWCVCLNEAVSGGKPPVRKAVDSLQSWHGSQFWVCITFCQLQTRLLIYYYFCQHFHLWTFSVALIGWQ